MRTHLFSSLWARKRRLLGGAIAVVIGVAFLAATLVLGDAMKGGIHSLMAEGNSNAGIAARLVITQRAVEKYVSSVFDKLGIPSTGTESRRVLAVLLYLRG